MCSARAQACMCVLGQGRGLGALAGPHLPSPPPALLSPRSPQGNARLDEVMAAAALTSLSTSPPLLGPPATGFHAGET